MGVDMDDGRFKIPLIPPIKRARLRYNIPFQANLLIHIQFTVLILSLATIQERQLDLNWLASYCYY
jgi:hypothetical protein